MKTKSILILILVFNMRILFAQDNCIPLIGSKALSFTTETTEGVLNFPEDFGDSWKILFSHPRNFTPVCTHEVLHLALIQDQLEELNVKIAILSTDTQEMHFKWKRAMEEILSKRAVPVKIKFPFIDDAKAKVARMYGMIPENAPDTRAVRGVFIISPDNIIQAVTFYPYSVGRSVEEMVRSIQALQVVSETNYYTPTNWQPFNDLLVPRYPYTQEELIKNPELLNEYYQIGTWLWYKRNRKP
jgi:peroxiredoxin 2/4